MSENTETTTSNAIDPTSEQAALARETEKVGLHGPKEMELWCDLTQEELYDKATDLAKLLGRKTKLDFELATVKSRLGAELKVAAADISGLAIEIERMAETRTVGVDQRLNVAASTVETIRLDTREVVSWRNMRDDERQMELKGDEPGADLGNAGSGEGDTHPEKEECGEEGSGTAQAAPYDPASAMKPRKTVKR